MEVSQRMVLLTALQKSKGAEETVYHLKAGSFAGVTLPPDWKHWENKVREKAIRIPTIPRFRYSVFLCSWSVQEQLSWSPGLYHLCLRWKVTIDTWDFTEISISPSLSELLFILRHGGRWDKWGFSHLQLYAELLLSLASFRSLVMK